MFDNRIHKTVSLSLFGAHVEVSFHVDVDFLWFLDLDLDSAVPNHSVLSKARTRWGTVVVLSNGASR